MEDFVMIEKEEIFEKLAECFAENVSEENKDAFSRRYKEMLSDQYDGFFEGIKNEAELRAAALMCVRCEKLISIGLNENAKRAKLFPDEKYKQLECLSFEIAALARDKKQGKEIAPKKSQAQYEEELGALFDEVSSLFRRTALKQYSEAMVDLSYIFGEDDKLSFRNSGY